MSLAQSLATMLADAKSSNAATRSRALDNLIMQTNRNDAQSKALVDAGLLRIVLDTLKPYPATSPFWLDDSAPEGEHPDAWLAFDIATNLAKWPSLRQLLIDNKLVDLLAELSKSETTYFGFEATEGLAYIVGRDEDGAHSTLLRGRPGNVKKIIDVLESALNGDGSYFGMRFGVYGRVLALQSLSIADVNKPMLRPAIPLMARVLDGGEQDCIELALRFLLEMSFDADSLTTAMMGLDTLKASLSRISDSDSDPRTKKTADSILFRFEEEARRVKQVREGGQTQQQQASQSNGGTKKHIMISYSWAQQPLVLECAKAVQAAGVPIWLDVLNMAGSTVDMMVDAIDNSAAVLVFVSPTYKESPNCRMEANYAVKQGKELIPVRVENFQLSGWLAFLLGSALYYDVFTTDMIPPAAPRFIAECQKNMGKAPMQAAANAKIVPPSSASSSYGAPSHIDTSKLAKMTASQIAELLKPVVAQPKLLAALTKSGATGKTFAAVVEVHSTGGLAVDLIKDVLGGAGARSTSLLGGGSAADRGCPTVVALDVLYELIRVCSSSSP